MLKQSSKFVLVIYKNRIEGKQFDYCLPFFTVESFALRILLPVFFEQGF